MHAPLDVLVVDDSAAIRARITDLLADLPAAMSITQAESLAGGMRALAATMPDLVILDLQMPDGSGIDLLKRIRVADPRPAVVILSNFASEPYRERCLNGGADFFLDKSSEFEQLANVVVSLTSHRRCAAPRLKRALAAAREQLSEAEARYRAVFDDGLTANFTSTPDGRLLSCNRAYAALFGFASVEEALAADLLTIYPSADRRSELLDLVRVRRSVTAFRTQLQRRDGLAVHIVANVTGEFDEHGGLRRIHGHVIDDTSRAEAENRLRASEQRYRGLFEHANDIVFTTDLELNFRSLNAAGERITGYSRAEAASVNLERIVPAAEAARLRSSLRDQLNGMPSQMFEIDVRTKHGAIVPLEVSARLLLVDGLPVGVQGIARDISERRAFETQTRQSQRIEALGRLAGGVAHDFNNLLTVILGNAQELIDAPENSDAAAQAREVLAAAQRAAELTQKLLAFSRGQVMVPTEVDLNSVVEDLNPMLRRLIGEHIEVSCSLAPELGHTRADRGQLEQAIINLLVNARDAMPDGGRVSIETANVTLDEDYTDRHAGATAGPHVMLAVSDTGVGMDAATAARIFEPFFTTKELGRGTGLGMSTVYGIVQQSGGTIWVYSEPGCGSVFKLYFPLCETDGSTPARPPEPEPHHVEGASLLLVEDDDGVRQYVKRALASHYRVVTAADPSEATSLDDSVIQTIDLLITDVVMPGGGGRQLADALIARRPGLRVLYMSGYTTDAVLQHGITDSARNFIPKPFSTRDLRAKVAEILG